MWPHSQEFWESVSKRLFICFHLLCLDWSKLWPQGWQADERNEKRYKKKEKVELWNPGEKKNVLTSLLLVIIAFIWAQRSTTVESLKRESVEKSPVLWSERWAHERKWSPAVVLHERSPAAHPKTAHSETASSETAHSERTSSETALLTFTTSTSVACDQHALDRISVILTF